ncbi:MAG TPA: protein kinase [Drouetiella sp.]
MPLNESFNKRGGQVKVAKLSTVPSADDITFSLTNAQHTPRKPVYLAWQVNDEKRMLVVTCGMNPYTEDARWVLRSGHENDSPIIWTHESADALMIHTLVSDSVSEVGPAAAIPEFLRPGAAPLEEKSGQNAPSLSAADKDFSSEAIGSIFDKRYEIIAEVGKGATSTVYRAKQIQIGRIVALKLMHPHLLREELNKKRFEQEAKATAALSHPNLVLVQDYGTSPLGRPFIVMDYVDGPSLDSIFASQGRLTSQQFLDVFLQCCRGLAHAHKRGVIHRDIKPSNIRLYKDEHNVITAKILDFGIAKLFTQEEEALKMTETGAVIGSPAYMSPEQSRAEQIDHRTDIYSLGVVMYQAVTGVLPFKGKDVFETLYKHIYEPPPTFASLNLGFRIPEPVETLIQKTLQKDPANRHQSMDELQRELTRLLEAISNSGAHTAFGYASSGAAGLDLANAAGTPSANYSGTAHTADEQQGVSDQSTDPDVEVAVNPGTSSGSGMPAYPGTSSGSGMSANPGTSAGAGGPANPGTSSGSGMPAHPGTSSGSGTPAYPGTSSGSGTPAYPGTSSDPEIPAYPGAPTDRGAPANAGPPATPKSPTTELDLLQAAKVITESDVAKARDITARHGGQISAMLIADGKLDRSLLEVAKRCTALVNATTLDLGRAIILLNYSQRSRLDFDETVEELGWKLS